MATTKKNFLDLVTKKDEKIHDYMQWRKDNKEWLDKSSAIAVKILSLMEVNKLTQKELASKMNVSPQHINKILQGQENLSLQTIAKLERVLQIQLVEISENLEIVLEPSSFVSFPYFQFQSPVTPVTTTEEYSKDSFSESSRELCLNAA